MKIEFLNLILLSRRILLWSMSVFSLRISFIFVDFDVLSIDFERLCLRVLGRTFLDVYGNLVMVNSIPEQLVYNLYFPKID